MAHRSVAWRNYVLAFDKEKTFDAALTLIYQRQTIHYTCTYDTTSGYHTVNGRGYFRSGSIPLACNILTAETVMPFDLST